MSDSEDLSDAETASTASVEVVMILNRLYDEEEMCYKFIDSRTDTVTLSRSDLMDGAANQKCVLQYERTNPPDWDAECPVCNAYTDSDNGCDECWCPDCDNKCRFKFGYNYGCCKHPVV
jgi:hypothetical protein